MRFIHPEGVSGYESLCLSPLAEGSPGERPLTPLTRAVAMLCTHTGLGTLTGRELEDFAARAEEYQQHLGPVLLPDGTRVRVTREQVLAHAGLVVNVGRVRNAASWEQHLSALCREYARAAQLLDTGAVDVPAAAARIRTAANSLPLLMMPGEEFTETDLALLQGAYGTLSTAVQALGQPAL